MYNIKTPEELKTQFVLGTINVGDVCDIVLNTSSSEILEAAYEISKAIRHEFSRHYIDWQLGENFHTPIWILQELSNEGGPLMYSILTGNPNTPPDALINIVLQSGEKARWHVFSHPNITKRVLETIRDHTVNEVTKHLAQIRLNYYEH
jgi:hypothetical protein